MFNKRLSPFEKRRAAFDKKEMSFFYEANVVLATTMHGFCSKSAWFLQVIHKYGT
ncbi:MAG: hypothetical protein ACRCR3_13815 [Tannerellaceae bacterium]